MRVKLHRHDFPVGGEVSLHRPAFGKTRSRPRCLAGDSAENVAVDAPNPPLVDVNGWTPRRRFSPNAGDFLTRILARQLIGDQTARAGQGVSPAGLPMLT